MTKLKITNPKILEYKSTHLLIHILGGINLNHLDKLRVTLKVTKVNGSKAIRHNIDLYNDNQLEKFVRTIAERLEINTTNVRTDFYRLIDELEAYRLELTTKSNIVEKTSKELSAQEEKEAINFLKSKDLLSKINELIGRSGVIGEVTNRLLMYLIFTSRLTQNPLHCISLGSSGVGKTHLQSKVAELIPKEDVIEITALSEQALYYFSRTELKHKLLLIEDLDGAEGVLYPLRELQSKRRITKTIAHRDNEGNTKTVHLVVEGPVSVSGCTTQEHIYEDNANRSFLLYIDESSQQDQKIMQYQRDVSSGVISFHKEDEIKEFLKNTQRVLKPIKVINPFAQYLTLPNSVFKPRRTNAHYLQFIEAITFIHQYQREHKTAKNGKNYIETTLEDIQTANILLKDVLIRKSDVLTGACRNYLEVLKAHLTKSNQTTFTNRGISTVLRIPLATVKRHHKQLLSAGIIKLTTKDKANGYTYEIVDYKEFESLQEDIATVLRQTLESLKVSSL